MSSLASQITSLTIVYSTVYSRVDQRKHQSFASLAFVWGIHRGPVNSPHKGPVTRKMFPFDDVIMISTISAWPSVGKWSWRIIGYNSDEEIVYAMSLPLVTNSCSILQFLIPNNWSHQSKIPIACQCLQRTGS